MGKVKIFILPILISVFLLPIGISYAQEDITIPEEEVLYDIVGEEQPILYDTGAEDPILYEDTSYDYDPSIAESEIIPDIPFSIDGPGGMTTSFLAFLAAYSIFVLVFGLGGYIFSSIALYKIGKDMGYDRPWFAWVPILSTVMTFQLGDQNPMLILLLLIPGIGGLVVAVLGIIALMNIAKKRGYDKNLGLIVLIPLASFVLLYLLAWKPKTTEAIAPSQISTPVEQPPVQ
ncbi:hypothetical protein A3K02_01020 [candidate division WS6 bacterium RIFOXYD1_FULL_33_8]|uniref:Uncharacterized protein n=2 Tax=Candidatus Dojkabacteria TaxID=74243 RepID=A0A0G0ACK5_9BACT|nr:MAG: hypothetical protein UR32_C0011G0008 [candidate division WS6 bacterium GW2011_GWE2_33_157]KKP44096.1 MAG: hypothetical protein UR34_C0006G0017 [candidate division WS6 bacterium GW2011_GWC1_33_20]KKP45031.1 MAG: hypothetical protein UR36_C0011G0008 [candidate division WS6 bacterium GW2011_GWF1_33_233]KKP54502.1 MAG: hypothetical protein UR45_C0013G0008 [candidate division WS6 bacterium GW2011_WS6_33_547]KKP54569.1 MAG: hypothetical protein UR47_C0014G0011 [candidate division WS6 bacteriu